MYFNLSILGAMLAASSSVIAAPTASQSSEGICVAIQQITTLSGALNDKLRGCNEPLEIGEAIVAEYQQITKVKTDFMSGFSFTGSATEVVTLTSEEQESVCESLVAFFHVDQTLLVTVAAEKEVISDAYCGNTFSLLRADAQVTESFVSGFYAYVPNCADNVRYQFQSLQREYSIAVATFKGFLR